jgi:hypothetical protein
VYCFGTILEHELVTKKSPQEIGKNHLATMEVSMKHAVEDLSMGVMTKKLQSLL